MTLKVAMTGNLSKSPGLVGAKAQEFEKAGMHVIFPKGLDTIDALMELPMLQRAERKEKKWVIVNSDILYVVNPGGDISPAVLSDIIFAGKAGNLIFFLERPKEASLNPLSLVIFKNAEDIKEAALEEFFRRSLRQAS